MNLGLGIYELELCMWQGGGGGEHKLDDSGDFGLLIPCSKRQLVDMG